MEQNYIYSKFGQGFRNLIYMGTWTPDMLIKRSHKIIYYVYALLWQMAMLTFIIIQIIDLSLVQGNFRKVTSNLCTSSITTGVFIKMTMLLWKRGRLKTLNTTLWEDLNECKNEDLPFFDGAYKHFCFIRKILYAGPMTVIPFWGIISYFTYKWGPRILPFAGFFPMRDINNDATYVPALLFEILIGYYASQTVMESDLAMIGILLQVQAHCKILNDRFTKLDEVGDQYEDEIKGKLYKREINEHLRTNRILRELKLLVKRHLELLKYCEQIDNVFDYTMALQLFGGAFMLVMIGVETTRVFSELRFSLFSQTSYLIFVMIDLYIICYHFSILATEFTNVKNAVYGSRWYAVDVRVRKLLLIIMLRAQKAPRFTYGKLFIIDVNAYKHLIKNIYNWLMLFRQLDMK